MDPQVLPALRIIPDPPALELQAMDEPDSKAAHTRVASRETELTVQIGVRQPGDDVQKGPGEHLQQRP